MSLLRTSNLTFTKTAPGYYDSSGKFVEGASETIPNVYGSLQPFKNHQEQRHILPRGFEGKETLIFYTQTQIKTDSQFDKTKAWETTIDGRDYQVFVVRPWSRYGLSSDHYETFLVRKDLPSGEA